MASDPTAGPEIRPGAEQGKEQGEEQGEGPGPGSEPILGPGDPAPVEELRPGGSSEVLLTCEHAGRRIPARYGSLGLTAAELDRHIAWDIGAGGVTRELSARLDAHAVLQRYSRLVADCNRHPHAYDFAPVASEIYPIPGNRDVTAAELEARRRAIFAPYHDAISAALDARAAAGRATVLVSVHTCTPVYHGVARPWHIGVMYDRDDRFARIVLDLLTRHGELTVGENQPYELDHVRDYAVPRHGEDRGIPHVQLEIRQDLVTDRSGQTSWAERLDPVLREALVELRARPLLPGS